MKDKVIQFQKKDPSQLKCCIFRGYGEENVKIQSLYNNVYTEWKNTWKEIFLTSKSPDSFCATNFIRQNYICCLYKNPNDIVGLVTASVFDLNFSPFQEHPYVSIFPENILTPSTSKARPRVMSGEYLSVHKNYRKNQSGVSYGTILVALLQKIFLREEADCLLGTARKKCKVPELCSKFGYKESGSIDKYGLQCELVVNYPRTVKFRISTFEQMMVAKLWKQKIELQPENNFKAAPFHKAA